MYDLEEQEQIDAIKAWWKHNGTNAVLLVAAVAAGALGYWGWRDYQVRQAEKAGALYQQLNASGKDPAALDKAAQTLLDQYPSSAFAPRAALLAAAGESVSDPAKARARLQWVVSNARDNGLVALARVRLAGLLADDKHYDEALKLLDGNTDAEFVSLTADRRGDILLAQGRVADARAAYRLSLDKARPTSALRPITQGKLAVLGDGP